MLRFSVTSFRAISPLYFLQDPAFGPGRAVPALPGTGRPKAAYARLRRAALRAVPLRRSFPPQRRKQQKPGGIPLIPTGPSVYISVTVTASLGRAIKRARQVTVSTGS